MHSPFDDGDIQCDTAPWRGGNGSHMQKVYLYPVFVPGSPPTPPPPSRGLSKQAENSCLWELCGECVRLQGLLICARWRGNPKCSRGPGWATSLLGWPSPALADIASFLSFSPEQGQDGAVARTTGSAALDGLGFKSWVCHLPAVSP